MDLYDITAGAKLAHDQSDEMDDKVTIAQNYLRALNLFDARIEEEGDRFAFATIIGNVELALLELQNSCREIRNATDLDRMRAPHTWSFKQLPFNQKRGAGLHFNDDGDVFLEWVHGDGRRTGTQYTAVMNYERDDRGGISEERPVAAKKKKAA